MSAQYFAGGGSAGSSFVNSQNTRRRFSLPSDEPPRNPTMANFPKPSESTPWSCPAPSVPAIITNARPVSVNPSTPRLTTVQENQIFADKSNRLLNIIKGTNGILNELRETNKNRFLVSYPVIDSLNKLSRSQSFAQKPDDAASSSQRVIDAVPRDYLRRSNSLSLPPSLKDNAQVDPLTHRLLTPETAQAFNHQLNVLKLDLKVGNLSTDVASLEKESIATLLDDRLAQSIKHLDNLHSRVADKSSKVLVTGDLNAGKSTFVNALLRRDLMPTDQQPCTTLFCEVLDATENDGVQEVHAVPDPAAYVRTDESTYDKVDLRHLYKYVTDGNEQYAILKIYTADKRSTQESLLHNGVVDIAVIDSPGLNRDSLKTTALFARQEEIDVVVFVVSAENHFTLSGKEFLWNAANEKAHIFIVVNRFDGIKDKERCKRLILEQIRQLSPATYADADELVHFVSSGAVQLDENAGEPSPEDFARLEQRLRAFVLENRSRSKLSPAKNYLQNLLTDVHILSESNRLAAATEHEKAMRELEANRPAYERLLAVRDRVLEDVEKLAEDTVEAIQSLARTRLEAAVEHVENVVAAVEYPGFLLIWQYAADLAESMVYAVQREVRACESHARKQTSEAVEKIHETGEEHLGEYVAQVDIEAPFTKHKGEHAFEVAVEMTDFIDLDLQERLGFGLMGAGFGGFGAVTMVGGRILGYRNLVSLLNVVGVNNARKWAGPVITIAGIGIVSYLIHDMRYAVERKLARKVREQLREAQYADRQSYRIARCSRKVLRITGWDLHGRFQHTVEAQEKLREDQTRVAEVSGEALVYFQGIAGKAEELTARVSAIETEGHRIK